MAAVSEHLDEAQVRHDNRAHVLHSWAPYGLDPLPIAGAEGSWIWDHEGNRYLDLSSQLVNVNIGHGHPKVVAAIQEQAARLATVSPALGSDVRGELARLVAEVTPGDLNVAFFTTGGAEAVENALRLARVFTGRHKILSAYRSYHGNTHAAMTATGEPRRWGSEPGLPGFVRFHGPYAYRSSFHARDEAEESERALAHLEEVLRYEGPGSIAAIILESIVGTNGILVPPDGYLAGVRELCDRHGIVMICDEVMAGFGRAGAWFACQLWNVEPDLITCAKGINSGYVPLGAVLISQRIAEAFRDRPYPGGLTYGGHPLACAAGVASVRAFHDEGIVERARRLGDEVLGPGLRELMERHPSVGEVRGRGCFWGVELVKDRATREMLVPFNAAGAALAPITELLAAARARGAVLLAHWNVLIVAPPLTTPDDDARHGLRVLDEVLEIADRVAAA